MLNIHDINEIEIEICSRKIQFKELYKIKGLLGVGAFGIVLEALNLKSNEIIALKII